MRYLRASVLVLLAVLALAPVAGAQDSYPGDDVPDADEAPPPPGDDDAPNPGGYEPALAPYGTWADVGGYGRVWHPLVTVGWRPYVTGNWAWTSYGWTWVSYEPWSWTFHYGRWALAPLGWVWVPGTVWGPAWVDWYWSDGYVGWAPLAPFGYVTVFDHFVFVHEHDFCSRRLDHVVVDHHRVPGEVLHHWRDHTGGARDFRPPPRDHIERVAHDPVPHVEGRPAGTVAPAPFRDRPRRERHLAGVDDRPRRGVEPRGVTPAGPLPPRWQRREHPAGAPDDGRPERRWHPAPPLVVEGGHSDARRRFRADDARPAPTELRGHLRMREGLPPSPPPTPLPPPGAGVAAGAQPVPGEVGVSGHGAHAAGGHGFVRPGPGALPGMGLR